MSFFIFLAIAVLLVLNRLVAHVSKDQLPARVDPVVWLLLPWMIGTFLFSMPIIIHRESLGVEVFLFVVASLAAFVVGACIPRFSGKYTIDAQVSSAPSLKMALFLAVLGVIGVLASVFDSIYTTGINISERLAGSGLNSAREATFEMAMQQVRGPFVLLEPLAGACFLHMLCVMSRAFQIGKSAVPRYMWWIFVGVSFLVAFNSLLVMVGRMALVILLVMLLIAVFMDRDQRFFRAIVRKGRFVLVSVSVSAALVVVSGVLYFSTAFVAKRSNDQSPIAALYVSHRATVEPWVYDAARELPAVGFGVFTLSYFTTPISTLAIYLDLSSEKMPGPYYGQYNFPGLAERVVKRVDKTQQKAWWDARLETFYPLTRNGFGGNVWATALRDFSVDVGRPFVPLVMFFFGWFSSHIVRKAYFQGDFSSLIMSCALLTVAAFNAFHSVLYIESVSFLINVWFVVKVYQWYSRSLAPSKISSVKVL